jgi:putative solute:sodium symporter small subunit
MVAAIVVLALVAPQFGGRVILGLPLSYIVALFGSIVLCLIAVARFAVRQDEIDQWHGAQEDL